MCAAAFGLGVAADDTLHPLPNLDLQPLAAAALFIKARALLGDDSFQPLLLRHLKQRLAVLCVVIGKSHRVARHQQCRQLALALLQRHAPPVVAIEIQQVERVIQHWHIGVPHRAPPARTKSRALLHQTERRFPSFIERHHFTIQNRRLGLDELRPCPSTPDNAASNHSDSATPAAPCRPSINAIARYPSHLISNSHSAPSNAFSTDSASMG